MRSRKLEPLRDGSRVTGTSEAIDVLIRLLMTTMDPRWVMQCDATYLSPTMALRTDGVFGGLIPGEPFYAHYDLEALAAAIREASSTGVVAKCVRGIVLVSLDPLQVHIPIALHCVSASGSVPAEFRVMCSAAPYGQGL
jgi:hypothetical protein